MTLEARRADAPTADSWFLRDRLAQFVQIHMPTCQRPLRHLLRSGGVCRATETRCFLKGLQGDVRTTKPGEAVKHSKKSWSMTRVRMVAQAQAAEVSRLKQQLVETGQASGSSQLVTFTCTGPQRKSHSSLLCLCRSCCTADYTRSPLMPVATTQYEASKRRSGRRTSR